MVQWQRVWSSIKELERVSHVEEKPCQVKSVWEGRGARERISWVGGGRRKETNQEEDTMSEDWREETDAVAQERSAAEYADDVQRGMISSTLRQYLRKASEVHPPVAATTSGETPERRSSTVPPIRKLWPETRSSPAESQ